MSLSIEERFISIFGVPEELQPYLNELADAEEMKLVTELGHEEASAAAIAARMGMSRADTEALLARAAYRHTVEWRTTPDGLKLYTGGNAGQRVTYWSAQEERESWAAIPEEVRSKIVEWHFWDNVRYHDLVRRTDLLRREPATTKLHNRDFLLLEEALALVDAAALHVVVPCDCRSTVMACDHARWNTCLRLDDRGRATLAKGEGEIVTREECRQIVIDADREGLMHTGQRAGNGLPAILNGNCCGCCSYPIREGMALGMDKLWPKVHFLAQRNEPACDDCGECVKRCYFGAFYVDELSGHVAFNGDLCHGCGLCSTGCPKSAVGMIALD